METFYGKVPSTMDALIIFEACRQGVLNRTTRRMVEEEKKVLCAGSIYVYDERESGIKRWTDGKYWSPSRIVGDFLVYQELEKRIPHIKSYDKLDDNLKQRIKDENLKFHISNKGTFIHRKDGLSKKTITVKLNEAFQHMVIYEEKEGNNNHLYPPRAYVELLNIEPGVDLTQNEALRKQNYVRLNEESPASRLRKGKVVERQRPSSNINIPPKRPVAPFQPLPSIAEALYSPVSTMQRTNDFELPELNITRIINLLSGSQENDSMVKLEKSEDSSWSVQSTNCIDNGINIWQNGEYPFPSRAFPSHTYRTMRDTVIPDTVKPLADQDSDFMDLVDYSRL